MDLSDIAYDLPASWYLLDLDPKTREDTAISQVEARIAADPALAPHGPELVELLVAFSGEAAEQGASAAALAWEPSTYGPATARLTVSATRRPGTDVEPEIEALVSGLSVPTPADMGLRDVTPLDLPFGPAVRLRLLLTDDDGIVLDAIQVWVPVPGQPATLVVSGSTPTLDLGDDLTGPS